jgi:hypothetical protein
MLIFVFGASLAAFVVVGETLHRFDERFSIC